MSSGLYRHLFSAVTAAVLMSGCATLWSPAQRFDQNFTSALETHDYRTALSLLDHLPSDDPRREQPEADRSALLREASKWRANQLSQALALSQEGLWNEGARLLAETDSRLPPPLSLEKELERYRQRQQPVAAAHIQAFALQRARDLAAELASLRQAQQSALTPEELEPLQTRLEADRDAVLTILEPVAHQALSKGQWQRAEELLTPLQAIAPTKERQLALTLARNKLANVRAQKRQQLDQVRQQELTEVLASARNARAEGDYSKARKAMEIAQKLAPNSSQVETEAQALASAIRNFVAARLADGDRLYAQGQIEAALDHWRRAQQAQPSSELEERIERAKRFLDRYQELKSSSAQATL